MPPAPLPVEVDAALSALQPPPGDAAARRQLLAACRRSVHAAADEWVAAAAARKHGADDRTILTEEWATGPLPVLRLLRCLDAPPIAMTPAGRSLQLFPDPAFADRWLFAGHRADALFGHRPATHRPPPGITLVLGAGNVSSMPVADALHALFVHGQAVLCKLSPLHASLQPILERAFAPLVTQRHLSFRVGDAGLGQALAGDTRIAAVHLTGSHATAAALRAGPHLANKRWTAELGNVTPVIVLPGNWPERELDWQARALAAQLLFNAGCNCVTPRVLLTASSWPQRRAFLDRIQVTLAELPPRRPFYPAAATWFEAAAERPVPADGRLPGLLRTDGSASRDATHLMAERFAPVLLEVPLPGDDVASFLGAATSLANDCLGTLAAQLAVPSTLRATDQPHLERAARALRKGTVAINANPGLSYALMNTPWGAFGGEHAIDDARGSGRGFVHGPRVALLPVDQVILRGPPIPSPLPPQFPWHRRGLDTLRALATFYATGSRLRLLPVLAHGLRP
ncbi:MAG: aldehyde dehydrogenase family protein [Planctomycetes bacterium]|nr:aldehyde dehydrogenase family protein [Planctomycetota bacterium]